MEKLLTSIRILDLVDVTIVSILLYYLLAWLKGSRAFQLLKGFLFLIVIFVISKWAGLYTMEWLLEKLGTILLFLLIVVFQPELRRGLERLGRHFLFGLFLSDQNKQDINTIHKITTAVAKLALSKTGALIVIEQLTGLNDYLESGIVLDAVVSKEILVSIFQKKSPLHDGAVLIQNDRISAACCLMPLTENKLDQKLGTRHRAAVGISEVSDALAIIVSEESGAISIAENGLLEQSFTKAQLKERLVSFYLKEQPGITNKFKGMFKTHA